MFVCVTIGLPAMPLHTILRSRTNCFTEPIECNFRYHWLSFAADFLNLLFLVLLAVICLKLILTFLSYINSQSSILCNEMELNQVLKTRKHVQMGRIAMSVRCKLTECTSQVQFLGDVRCSSSLKSELKSKCVQPFYSFRNLLLTGNS